MQNIMSTFHPFKFIGIIDGLLIPIHRVIALVLPDFLERDLKDPKVRNQIVVLADEGLVRQYPEAKVIPKATRERLIRKLLNITLDDVLLPEQP